ncbi:hypothetical protein OAV62_01250 [bacterium]|nr:hypothetical protein [bacterium]
MSCQSVDSETDKPWLSQYLNLDNSSMWYTHWKGGAKFKTQGATIGTPGAPEPQKTSIMDEASAKKYFTKRAAIDGDCGTDSCHLLMAPDYTKLKKIQRTGSLNYGPADKCGGCPKNGTFTGWMTPNKESICGIRRNICPQIGGGYIDDKPTWRSGIIRHNQRKGKKDLWSTANFVDNVRCNYKKDALRNEDDVANLKKAIQDGRVPDNFEKPLIQAYCQVKKDDGTYPREHTPTCVNFCFEARDSDNKCPDGMDWEKYHCKGKRVMDQGGNDDPGSICATYCNQAKETCEKSKQEYCESEYERHMTNRKSALKLRPIAMKPDHGSIGVFQYIKNIFSTEEPIHYTTASLAAIQQAQTTTKDDFEKFLQGDCACYLPDNVYKEYATSLADRMGVNDFLRQEIMDKRKCMFPGCPCEGNLQICSQTATVIIDGSNVTAESVGNIQQEMNCLMTMEGRNCRIKKEADPPKFGKCENGKQTALKYDFESGSDANCATDPRFMMTKDCGVGTVEPIDDGVEPIDDGVEPIDDGVGTDDPVVKPVVKDPSVETPDKKTGGDKGGINKNLIIGIVVAVVVVIIIILLIFALSGGSSKVAPRMAAATRMFNQMT